MVRRNLVDAVLKTLEVDESGDVTIETYLKELPPEVLEDDTAFNNWSINTLMEGFLVWANGPNWEEFLKTAKTGDYPNKKG